MDRSGAGGREGVAAVSSRLDDARVHYADRGFLEPFPLLSSRECGAVIGDASRTAPEMSWLKGLHEFDSACTRAARSPVLIEIVRELLGDEVILWSAQLIEQAPGVRHRWHADFEAMTWPTVDVWIGLRGVGSNSFLSAYERSHRWGVAPQEVSPELDLLDDDIVTREAGRIDPLSRRRDFPMAVGEALVFDGRIWHASHTSGTAVRSALLLQYSPASAEPRILTGLKPMPMWSAQQPACLMVVGAGSTLAPSNHVIEPQPFRRRRLRRFSGRVVRWVGLHRVWRRVRGVALQRNRSSAGE